MKGVQRSAQSVTDRLVAAGCVAADEEALELVAAAPDDETLELWTCRREQGEPLAWITGSLTFCGQEVHVDPGVYVPRAQSEDLARRAAIVLADIGGRAADLCTGSGAVAVHLMAEAPTCGVIGVDIDLGAVRCARRNGVLVARGDLDEALRPRAFSVVTAVAPYVPSGELRLLPADVQRYEPGVALDGGIEGLDVVRRVVMASARLLLPEGWLFTELGGDQDEVLSSTLERAGFGSVDCWYDEDGDLRGLAAQLTSV